MRATGKPRSGRAARKASDRAAAHGVPDKRSRQLYDEFLARGSLDRLQKLLARYELFRLAMHVPGDIVECGVFKGSGLYAWARLQGLLRPMNQYRIVGFDFFEAPREAVLRFAQDRRTLQQHAVGWAPREQILGNLKRLGATNVELIAGDIVETAKAYARQLGRRIALLYLDLDTYEATRGSLEHLFPLVSPGGVVAFDEYGLGSYGESDAVDDFFRGRRVALRSFAWGNTPTAYFVKEATT